MAEDDTPYAALEKAVCDYGEAAMENFLRCRAFGRAVVDGLPDFLGCPPDCVSAVPPKGAFDPAKDYGDEAFGTDPSRPVRLEPITFGVCVIVPNAEDSGSLWLRTGVRLEMAGDGFDVFVAGQPRLRAPLDWEGGEDGLRAVHQAIHAELISVFKTDLAAFADERFEGGIGFVPQKVGFHG